VPRDIAEAVAPDITRFADDVLEPQVFDWVTDAERNQPYVTGGGRNAFGQPVGTKLFVTEGWRKLQEFSIEKGYASYSGSSKRAFHSLTKSFVVVS
jgi:hypothetical protein